MIFFLSCKTLIDKEDINSKVYFFEQNNMTSIQMIECSDMISHKTLGLRVIDSIPRQLIKKIKGSIEKGSFNGNIPDIRYRVEIGQDVVCVDYRGNFFTDKGLKGNIDYLFELEEYINENIDSSNLVGPSSKPPSLDK